MNENEIVWLRGIFGHIEVRCAGNTASLAAVQSSLVFVLCDAELWNRQKLCMHTDIHHWDMLWVLMKTKQSSQVLSLSVDVLQRKL